MDSNTFWSLIDRTTTFEADQDEQLHALDDLLGMLGTEEIEAFEKAFRRELQKTQTWDLWGAYAVIHGGADDDGFQYFQYWLISRGREVFDLAVADADELADIIPEAQDSPCEFEEFAYVATDVWVRKTGRDPVTDSGGVFQHVVSTPKLSGVPAKETPAHLSRRYPRLWDRFGENPLG